MEGAVDVAKIFWSGRSQAVRLPKQFRFGTDQVRVRRHGNSVILEPLRRIGPGSRRLSARSMLISRWPRPIALEHFCLGEHILR
jgi:virulence-associated protein VagC